MSCRGRHLGFDRTGNSADRENPILVFLERNVKWIGIRPPVAGIWPFEIRHIMRCVFGTPHFEGRGGRRGSSITIRTIRKIEWLCLHTDIWQRLQLYKFVYAGLCDRVFYTRH